MVDNSPATATQRSHHALTRWYVLPVTISEDTMTWIYPILSQFPPFGFPKLKFITIFIDPVIFVNAKIELLGVYPSSRLYIHA